MLSAQGIVWVINAAWKRATDVRELMLKELRMSSGVDLYKNLAIVLNFLPRTANKTAYSEIKQRHKENWKRLCYDGFRVKVGLLNLFVARLNAFDENLLTWVLRLSLHQERFVEWIMQREDVMFQWHPDLRKGVEDEVNNIDIYGININPKYLMEKPSASRCTKMHVLSFCFAWCG